MMERNVRFPAVAGQFYPDDPVRLRRMIEGSFKHELGPGSLPKKGDDTFCGGVVPHAGYMYSGPVAAHFYYRLAARKKPDAVVVIGPNHHGVGAGISTTHEDFLTPLGKMPAHNEIIKELRGDIVSIDPMAHRYEHSIEVQLPFIQYVMGEVPLVPIAMHNQDYSFASELGRILRSIMDRYDIVVIASSDFSHYVPPKVAYDRDLKAIEYIKKCDSIGFYNYIIRKRVSVCGYGPIISAMSACCPSDVELLKYATSGDVIASGQVVGYSSILFNKK